MNIVNTHIIEAASQCLVSAEIFQDSNDPHAIFINQNWQPILYQHAVRELALPDGTLKTGSAAKELLTDNQIVDWRWDWINICQQQEPGFNRKTFYLVRNGSVEGALHAKFPNPSMLNEGFDLVYVDFFAVAPWNRQHYGQTQVYKGVGTSLFIHTLNCSQNLGYRGVIGLHSLIQAEPFYNKLGMTPIYCDLGYSNMTYFELPRENVVQYLS